MKVKNITSDKGNIIPNQFVIEKDNMLYFQSYQSIIVAIDTKLNTISLDSNYWNYSRTTSKYRNIFLGESTKETEENIKSGKYKLVNLN